MRIGVIGGGLAGVGTALELAGGNHTVELFEREGACLTQASLQNEGKVHLGFVYGQDPSLATARLMARGAYTFAPLLRRWLELDTLPLAESSAFHYFFHERSLQCGDTLAAFYARVVALLHEERARPGARYLSCDPPPACRRLSARERATVAGPGIRDVFITSELALDPRPLAALLRARLAADPRIVTHLGTRVQSAAPDHAGVTLRVQGAAGVTRVERFDHVVNASWDDLIRLDTTAGLPPRGPWSYRFKRYLRMAVEATHAVPSATIVLGPFGDVVRYDNGELFLSWYPAGCTGINTEERHPDVGAVLDDASSRQLRATVVGALAALVPALDDVPAATVAGATVEGGVILALGVTDVDDPSSGLHARTTVGPRSQGRYHSLDTGKWTTSPLFAHALASRIMGRA